MKLEKCIINALREACAERGSAAELARNSGVKAPNISKYLAGRTKALDMWTFTMLYPYLRKHLPKDWRAQCGLTENSYRGLELQTVLGPKEGAIVAGAGSIERVKDLELAKSLTPEEWQAIAEYFTENKLEKYALLTKIEKERQEKLKPQ